jgi:preprotein translocase subunit SecD
MLKPNNRLLIFIIVLIAVAVFIVWPNNPGINIDQSWLKVQKSFATRLGLDLVGGVQAMLEADIPPDQAVDAEAMKTAVQIVENRVNGLGVTEAVVQPAGQRRIVVELPGQTDPAQALAALKQTGLLEFVDMSSISQQQALALEGTKIQTDYALSDTTGVTETITGTQPAQIFHTVMTGAGLKNAIATRTTAGKYEVAFELKGDDIQKFAEFTRNNVGNVLAIVLDKVVISAPTINDAITDGKGVITGNFDLNSSNALAVQLRYGSLPVPLKIVTSTTVGPTLGQDSLRRSLIGGIIGLSLVMLFMALYYRLPGVIADVALLVYALLTFAIFKLIPVTLTLPGIAGFVLSIGVAVDANILIFERMKEELRAGRNLRQAIDLGWGRAWLSIRDSNFSTLITCAILFWFGSTFGASIVKGFSLTLAIGVFVSMFTAIVVTRTFLHLVLDRIKSADLKSLFGAA